MTMRNRRVWFQSVVALAANSYLVGFIRGDIFRGSSKAVCIPFLNCYSCPGAVASCPLGSLQTLLASARFRWSLAEYQVGLYVIGALGLVAAVAGRLPCGWLCPFGLLQELLHKIPSPKLPVPRGLGHLRWAFLLVAVVGLPLLLVGSSGTGEPWFCKVVCPAGTLEAGIPLLLLNPELRSEAGLLFVLKVAILVFFLLAMVFTMRPFCRTVCPIGLLLGLLNRVSAYRLAVDRAACDDCLSCERACPVSVPVRVEPNDAGCIRCLRCVDACPRGCISQELLGSRIGRAGVPAAGGRTKQA